MEDFDKIFELMQYKADADKTAVDFINPEEPEERNIGMGGILKAAAGSLLSGEGYGKAVYEYIDETATNEADHDYLREKAKLIGSDYLTALLGNPYTGITNIGELVTGIPGSYRGQSINLWRDISGSEKARNKSLGLEDAPNLLDIYLGYSSPEDEGLQSVEGTNAYNVEPYVNFINFLGPPGDTELFKDRLYELKPGDTIDPADWGVAAQYQESVDLGRTSWRVGRDTDGDFFVTLSDKWDFGGSVDDPGYSLGYVGKLMDKIGKHPIDFQGKWYFEMSDIAVDPAIENRLIDTGSPGYGY